MTNVLSVFYVIFETLPKDNNLGINPEGFWVKYIVFRAPAIVITIMNAYMVPPLVDNSTQLILLTLKKCTSTDMEHILSFADKCNSLRSYIILFFRSMTSIIVPLMAAFILIPRCGNGWAQYWKQCENSGKSVLNTNDHDGLSITFVLDLDINLSSYDAICKSNDLINIISNSDQLNQCLRSFFDLWTPIIYVKFLLFNLTLWIPYLIKKYNVKAWIEYACKRVCISIKKSNRDNDDDDNDDKDEELLGVKFDSKSFDIDSEYAALATKLELFFIFMPFVPFILPIATAALYSNYIVFGKMTRDLNETLTINDSNQHGHDKELEFEQELEMRKWKNVLFWERFPFKLLHISLFFGQILFIMISFNVLKQWLNIVFICCLVLMDVFFVFNGCFGYGCNFCNPDANGINLVSNSFYKL